jgi:hypothetical protein
MTRHVRLVEVYVNKAIALARVTACGEQVDAAPGEIASLEKDKGLRPECPFAS